MRPLSTCLTLLLGLALTACDSVPGLPSLEPAARIEITGRAVYVNGAPARDGQRLRTGEQIRTGAESAARIYWSDGTWLQINPNSDPIWHWDESTGTLQVNVLFGAFYIDTAGRKVRVEHPLAASLWGSEGAIYTDRNTVFEANLLEGRMSLLRPAAERLQPGQTVTVRAGAAPVVTRTTDATLARIDRDFDRWARLLAREQHRDGALAPAEAETGDPDRDSYDGDTGGDSE